MVWKKWIALVMGTAGLTTRISAAPCTVCKNAAIPLSPEKSFTIPGFNIANTCGDLDSLIALVIPNATDSRCETIQSLGAACGCPDTIRENSCHLCPKGNSVTLPDKELSVFKGLFRGFVPTCEILEAYLFSTDAYEPLCSISQSFIGDYCGCDVNNLPDDNAVPCSFCPNGDQVGEPDKVLNITGLPFETCGQLEVALDLLLVNTSAQCHVLQSLGTYCGCEKGENACSLCPDGSNVSLTDKHVEFVKDELGGITPTCAMLEAYTESFDADSKQCATFQFGSGFCGCPPIENHCEFCPREHGFQVPESYWQIRVPELNRFLGFTPTCELSYAFQYQISAHDALCLYGQQRSDLCGCNGGVWDYLGADTHAKKAALSWVPRASAILAFIVRYQMALA
jgi:hypothetical protein